MKMPKRLKLKTFLGKQIQATDVATIKRACISLCVERAKHGDTAPMTAQRHTGSMNMKI